MKKKPLKLNKVPNHLAIILDGNGRWAKKRGLPRSLGHLAGANNIFKIVSACENLNIKMLTIYAFSTENFKRPQEEVNYLMNLPFDLYEKYQNKLTNDLKVKIVHVGSKENLNEDLVKLIKKIEDETKNNKGLVLNVAFNYGFYDELNNAIIKISKDRESLEKVDLYPYLDVKEPVDLLIRTSGEQRLSNFLLYQLAYAELYFAKKHWPAFKEKDLIKAIKNYQHRKRRFGGLS